MSEETKISAKVQKLIDSVSQLSVLELSELVKALEEKFDVKAVATAPVAAATAAGATAPVAEEKNEFDVVITSAGANKIAVIKVIREFKPELGLKEAKDMVDACPTDLGTMKKDAAAEAKTKLEAAGAQVELK